MLYLSKQEFSQLSEQEKSDYYEQLLDEKNSAVTVAQTEALILEFEKLDYKDSDQIVDELILISAEQRKADAMYISEKRKKGLLISVLVVCAAVLVASAVVIIGMF